MKKNYGLYNQLAKFYDLLDSYYELILYHKMREKYISKLTRSKILEVGVGTGKNLSYYSSDNLEIIGLDKSIGMLHEARKKLTNMNPEKKNITKLFHVDEKWGFKENYFDFVVATYVLCTNDDPTGLIKMIHDSLRTGGTLILFEWVPSRKGLRNLTLKMAHPLLHLFLGVSVYKSSSLYFFKKSDWVMSKKEFFDKENFVFILKKIK